MCIFSQPVELVSNTHIFARVANGTQFLAYEMNLSTSTENAMILPVPVAHGAGEDALQFISLEDYPDFFDDLDALFPAVAIAAAGLDTERDSDWSLGPSIALPLPIFDSGEARRAKARAQAIAARQRLTHHLEIVARVVVFRDFADVLARRLAVAQMR